MMMLSTKGLCASVPRSVYITTSPGPLGLHALVTTVAQIQTRRLVWLCPIAAVHMGILEFHPTGKLRFSYSVDGKQHQFEVAF